VKPIMVLPPEVMSAADIELLRENGICVVVASDPATLRFLDSIPSASARDKIDDAAIKLSRVLLNGMWGKYSNMTVLSRQDFAKIFVDLLVEGTSLDERGTPQEYEQLIFDQAKEAEITRLAREEARAERAAKKQAAAEKREGKK
jgi:hypothetical protein